MARKTMVSRSTGILESKDRGDANVPTVMRAVTLAADRREVDPGAVLSFRYDWEGGLRGAAHQVERREPTRRRPGRIKVDVGDVGENISFGVVPGLDGSERCAVHTTQAQQLPLLTRHPSQQHVGPGAHQHAPRRALL